MYTAHRLKRNNWGNSKINYNLLLKTLSQHPKERTYITVTTKGTLALTGRSEESNQNME
jgi:hypothetical protein